MIHNRFTCFDSADNIQNRSVLPKFLAQRCLNPDSSQFLLQADFRSVTLQIWSKTAKSRHSSNNTSVIHGNFGTSHFSQVRSYSSLGWQVYAIQSKMVAISRDSALILISCRTLQRMRRHIHCSTYSVPQFCCRRLLR